MNDLPDEILIKILTYLDPDDWYHSLHLVCQKWRELTVLLIKKFNTISYDGSTSDLIFSTGSINRKCTFHIENWIVDQKPSMLKWLIKYCADHVKNVAFEILDTDDHRLTFVELLIAHLTLYCPNISNLSLCGSVILILKSLNSWKLSLNNLEALIVKEESEFFSQNFPANFSHDEQDYVRNTSEFAEYLIKNCGNLQKIHVEFHNVAGPAESCFEHLAQLKLESLTWLLYKPHDGIYIEGLLDAISHLGRFGAVVCASQFGAGPFWSVPAILAPTVSAPDTE
uniref:F-box domain-containing protein n=1 Tax=Romanomermis culicivorax TaxID=13658 RepID=A0A915I7T9_ROMCU